MKNGMPWEADLLAGQNLPYNQGIDILIHKFNDRGFKRESFFIFKIPKETGIYYLEDTNPRTIDSLTGAAYYTLLDDGGVSGDQFDLLLTDEVTDFIEITEITDKEVKGNFQMSFIKDDTYPSADPTAPDTIIFTGGVFETEILER